MWLYHYCNQEAFLSIMENKETWFSSLRSSNDHMEGTWILEKFKQICARDKEISPVHDSINRYIDQNGEVVDAFGFCMSENGDLLSQWRGYTDNGEGFSIGFSKDLLEKVAEQDAPPFRLAQIEYDEKNQTDFLFPLYWELKRKINQNYFQAGAFNEMAAKDFLQSSPDTSFVLLLRLLNDIFLYKNPAFSEEKEWRLIATHLERTTDHVSFRASQRRLSPFLKYRFDRCPEIVQRVVLGPKNETPIRTVERFVSQCGFTNVEIVKSDATYV